MADEEDDATDGKRQSARGRAVPNIIDRAAVVLAVLPDGAMAGAMMDVVKVYMPDIAAMAAGRDLDLVRERIYAAIESLTRQPDPPLEETRRQHEGAFRLAVATLAAFGMDPQAATDLCRLVPAMTEARRAKLLDADDMRKLRVRRVEALCGERFSEATDIDRELNARFLASLRRRDK